MSSDPRVSIIIPVYGVENYIEKCLESVLQQTFTSFECLIVDDGSVDGSIEIAKETVGDDQRFIFLEKENGGQGTARNLGLDYAKGAYIAFLDSDDYYDKSLLSMVVDEFAKDSSVDIVSFGVNKVDEEGVVLDALNKGDTILNTNDDVLLLNRTLTSYFWDKVFRRESIVDFRFSTSIRTYEDVDLLYRVLYRNKVRVIPCFLYNYTQRKGSTTYSFPRSFIEDKYAILVNAKKFLIDNDIYYENKNYYESYFLIEMYYKPLIVIARYSNSYSSDIARLKSKTGFEFLSFDKIFSLNRSLWGKAMVSLAVFKINKYFFLSGLRLFYLLKK